MKKVIVLTHGKLSEGFLSAFETIGGKENGFETIAMEAKDSPSIVLKKIQNTLAKYSSDDTIILLTDIPAGSTTKIAVSFLKDYKNLYIVSGINLGLLLEIMLDPMEEVDESIRRAISLSKESIQFINDELKIFNTMRDQTEGT